MHTVKAWKHPECYTGATWEGWYSAGFGQSRDSDALESSNFQSAYDGLKSLAAELSVETSDIPGRYDGRSGRTSHPRLTAHRIRVSTLVRCGGNLK